MSALPAPLVPKECDLRDRDGLAVPALPVDISAALEDGFMLWHDELLTVVRLRLMARAWRNNPAASLLNVPDRFPNMIWVSPRRWKRVSEAALSDWMLCSDGRIYHPWLAEQALKAWRRLNSRRRLDVSGPEWALLRLQVFRRDNFVCQYCDSKVGPFQCDHVVSVARGGLNISSNLVTACEDCNRRKHAMPVERFLAAQPARLASILARLQTVGGMA